MLIETERLILRPVILEDAADIFEYSRESEVGPNAGWKPHTDIEETISIMYDVFIGKKLIFAIVYKQTKRVIGTIGLIGDLKRDNDRALMIGYASGSKFWGYGYMTEASNAIIQYVFEKMDIDIISAYCYPDNVRSKNVLKKVGFKFEGTLRLCEKHFDGKVYDNDCFSITKEDFQSLHL